MVIQVSVINTVLCCLLGTSLGITTAADVHRRSTDALNWRTNQNTERVTTWQHCVVSLHYQTAIL